MGEGGIARRIKANSELVLMRNIYNVATDDGTESFQPSQLKLFMIELVQLNLPVQLWFWRSIVVATVVSFVAS